MAPHGPHLSDVGGGPSGQREGVFEVQEGDLPGPTELLGDLVLAETILRQDQVDLNVGRQLAVPHDRGVGREGGELGVRVFWVRSQQGSR